MKKTNRYFTPMASVVLLIFAAILFFTYLQTSQAKKNTSQIAHSQDVLLCTSHILNAATALAADSRDFATSADTALIASLVTSKNDIYRLIDTLRKLTIGNADQQMLTDSLLLYVNKRIDYADNLVRHQKMSGSHQTLQPGASVKIGQPYPDRMNSLLKQMENAETTELLQRKLSRQRAMSLLNNTIIAIIIIFLSLLFIFIRKEQSNIAAGNKSNAQIETLNQQVNQSNDAIYTVDKNLNIQTWNFGAEKIYGYTSDEAVGKKINELLQTSITDSRQQEISATLREKNYWSGELKRKSKAGGDIYVMTSLTNRKNAKGEIDGIIGVSVDVTQQKHQRAQIDHLASLVEQSSDAILSVDLGLRILTWNKGAELLHGYTKEEVLGKTSTEIGIIRNVDEEMSAVHQRLFEQGGFTYEATLYRKDGSSFYASFSINTFKDEQGEIIGIFFIAKDVSQRRQLEEQLKKYSQELEEKVKERTEEIYKNEKRFRALIENNFDMISLFDQSFNIIYRSPSTERNTGWKTEDMIGVIGTKYVHKDDKAEAGGIIQDIIANPGKSRNMLTRYLHKHGHYLWLEGVITNLLHDEDIKAIVFNFHDVTERIEAEEKLASSELRFRLLIENSAEGISLLDEHSNVLYRSPSAYKIIGNNQKENVISLAHPDDLENFKNKFAEALSNPGIAVPYLVRYYNASGYYFWAEGIFNNLLHVKGVNAVVANYRDVTDRVIAQEKLASSELLFRSVIEHIAEGITLTDASMNTFYISPSASKIVGEHLVFNLRGIAHPGDFENARRARQEALDHPAQAVPFKGRFLNPSGEYSWLEGTLNNLLHLIGVEAIVSNFRDVTEQKKAEEKLADSELRFRALVEHSAEGISLTDEASNTVYRSPSAIRILGNASLVNLRNYAHPNNIEELQNVREESFRKPGVPVYFEGRFLHPHGHHYWMEGSLTNMLSIKGVEAIVANFRDITEKKKLEIRLHEQQQKEQLNITAAWVQAQERERNTIAQEIHDNVNQILAGTNLFLSIAKNNPEKSLEHIETSMQSISAAIEENRRLAHELVTPDFETIKLKDLLRSLTDQMLKLSGIDTHIHVGHFLENQLKDEQKLAIYRIAQEQCSNIVKYAQASMVNISLDIAEGIFTMSIADNGKGMEPVKVVNGIGLKNIKSRLTILNGGAKVITAPDKGFTLEIRMPCAK